MAGGGALVAAAEGLARDADEAAGNIGEATASLFEKTADNEESNLAGTLDTDAQAAQNLTRAAATGEQTVDQGAADAAPITEGGTSGPGEIPPTGDVTSTPANPVTSSGVGPCGKVGEPVDVVGGQMVTATVDVSLPGVLPLVLRRAYASGYRSGRLFGPGWASTLDIRVQIDTDGIHVAGDDAQILDYPVPTQPTRAVMPTEGARWPLTWDHASDEIRVQDVQQGRTWHFTTLGTTSTRTGHTRPLTAISDRNGNRITFLRDQDGLPTQIQHSGGYRIAVDTTYTAAGFRITALRLLDATNSDQGSALLTYHYDPRGRLVELVDSTGLPFVYEHDTTDRIVAWIDRTGYRFEYTYDETGRVVRTTGDSGYLSGNLAYDPDNHVTTYTDSLGHSTEHHYDQYGHITKTIDPLGNATCTDYDRYGRLLSYADPLGNATHYTLNEHGDPIRIDRPDGTVLLVEYDARRAPVRVTGPDGGVWQYAYDDRGNLSSAANPAGAVSRYEAGERGEPTQLIDALGQVTSVTTDRAGLPVTIADATGLAWTVDRDARGRVVAVTDPLGAVTATVLDGEGHPLSRAYPDGTGESWSWDANGNLTAHTDQAGHTTEFEVGPFRQVVARTDPDGTRYTFAHDTELRLSEVTNPQASAWRYHYDAAGNLVGEQDFNDRHLSYAHDAAGRVVRRVNGAGESIDLTRGALGQVQEQRTGDGEVTTFAYDAAGRLVRAQSRDSDLSFTRDALGRVLSETADGHTVTTTFDALDRRTSRVTPTGHVSSWQYDPAGRPLALTSGAREISFGYDGVGREAYRWLGANTALTREHDQLGRVTAQRLLNVEGPPQARTARVLQERSWTYRADGTPDSITDATTGTQRFELDQLGRVTAVHAATWSETYAYDSVGNLSHAADTRAPDAATSGPRQLVGTLLRQAGRTHYEYDAQGRLTRAVRRTLSGRQKIWTYRYDAHDRLTSATNPAGENWRYRYDPLGRRIAKQRLGDDGAPVEETRFSWDGAVLAEEQRAEAGTASVTATSWDHEPDTWTPITQDRRTYYSSAPQDAVDEQFHAIVTDLVGTPAELVTVEGAIAWQRQTGLWGNPLAGQAGGEGADCPLRFPGQYHDAETGLDYNYQRYYDAGTGRYTTPDPLGLVPAPNHHAYVDNPLSWIDPLGLAAYTGGPAPIPQVDSPRLQNIINGLYKGVGNPNLVGDGSAMAAASAEFNGRTGVEQRDHVTSTDQLRNGLDKFLADDETRLKGGKKVPNIKTARDVEVATSLRSAIDDAQSGQYDGYQNYPGLGSCP